MHWTDVWFGDSMAPKTVRTLLTPASWLYALGWRTYQSVYDLGLKKSQAPHQPVFCIGNLTTGGTGKTPVTVFIAHMLHELGFKVVVGCSGYGSSASEGAEVAPQGPISASRWGDEAALLRLSLPEIPLIVGRARVTAAKLCNETYPDSVLLMDDGLQHLPLRKDVKIVLDPDIPNRRCLPAGPYREPWRPQREDELKIPGKFEVRAHPLLFLERWESVVPNPRKANALCAIGTPGSFMDSLEAAGVQLEQRKILPDHSPLRDGNLFDGLPAEEPLVVTLKDWVKLRERPDLGSRRILVANHRVEIEPFSELNDWIKNRLHEVVTKGT
jgi:tetraacyldisaccharide 4'-kinase